MIEKWKVGKNTPIVVHLMHIETDVVATARFELSSFAPNRETIPLT